MTTNPDERRGADDELPSGTCVGEYVVERVLGNGGMGTVYGAVHPMIGKRVAIKVLSGRSSADHEAVARFVQEARVVNQIAHENIVDIFAFGELPDGRAYFVMEWLRGQSLAARIGRGAMSVRETVTILGALVRAIEAAHAAGVIHRDLKPDNVFLVDGDGGPRVKLLDFGIAKLQAGPALPRRTETGVTVGTPAYMSPEQARGLALDARTDAYSLGVVAYEMLCGRTPFEDEGSSVEILHAHLAKPPRPPRELRPDLPVELDALVVGLLAKAAEERPALAEVRQHLAAIATLPDASAMTTQASIAVVERAGGRRRAWIAGLVVAGAVGAVAVAVIASGGGGGGGSGGDASTSTRRTTSAPASTPAVDAAVAPSIDATIAPPIDGAVAPPIDAAPIDAPARLVVTPATHGDHRPRTPPVKPAGTDPDGVVNPFGPK